MIVAPIAATLIQLAISRSREFAADAGAARITNQPLALASALQKLEAFSLKRPMAAATPATAHLFIVSPLRGSGFVKLFATHPPMEERIARMQAMATGAAG
jgi:heat shock protein HtpX